MAKHKLKITLEISDEDIKFIVDEASKGVRYWSGEWKLEGLAIGNYFTYGEALVDGKRIRVHDGEDDKWYILTKKKLLTGISLMEKFEFDEYDMYDCERVIQYALFGKQVYA